MQGKSYQDMSFDELEEALARKFNMTSERIKSITNKNQEKMKTSKITKCEFTREWNGSNGTIYYHSIELDNGDFGDIGTKEKLPAKLSPGAEINYEIIADGEYKGKKKYKIKLVSNFMQQAGTQQSSAPSSSNYSSANKDENIARSVALKASVDMNHSDDPAKVIAVAQIFEAYLLKGIAPTDDAASNAQSTAKMDANDDLPF